MRLPAFAHMASQMSGVPLQARRSSTQVMLGCHCGPDGTRARCDTSLVVIMIVLPDALLVGPYSVKLGRNQNNIILHNIMVN